MLLQYSPPLLVSMCHGRKYKMLEWGLRCFISAYWQLISSNTCIAYAGRLGLNGRFYLELLGS